MRRVRVLVTVALTVAVSSPAAFGQTPDTLQALSLEELMEIEVSTVSRVPNRHDDLASTRLEAAFVEGLPASPRVIVPLQFDNQLHGNSHGLEISADLRPTTRWRWTAAYSLLRMQLTPDAPGADASQEAIWEGSSPTHQLQLQSSVDLPADVELDWLFRFVSALPHESVPAYATSDVRLGWHVNRSLELSVVGRNLHHAPSSSARVRPEPRSGAPSTPRSRGDGDVPNGGRGMKDG